MAMLATTTTTITSDPGILCFHHCNVKVFCFTLPHTCPSCKTELHTGGCAGASAGAGGGASGASTSSTKLLPFRLPYPFVRASQYPCAIVLRPTTGDFLNDYNNATDLHIAVTKSSGGLVEFDRHGLRRHRADNMPDWWQCLLVGDVPEPWYDYWDQILLEVCKQPARWSIAHYDEDTHNCYTFVLAFLQALAYDKLSVPARSKTNFCEKYIVPRTTTAGKYISLYRKLRDAGIYVHPHHQQHNGNNSKRYTSHNNSTNNTNNIANNVSNANNTSSNQHKQRTSTQPSLSQSQSLSSRPHHGQSRPGKVRTSAVDGGTAAATASSVAAGVFSTAKSKTKSTTTPPSSIMSRPPKLCTIEE